MIKFSKILPLLAFSLVLLGSGAATVSAAATPDWLKSNDTGAPGTQLILAESDNQDAKKGMPRSGSLVMPATASEDQTEKKCMTVCERWGKDCIIDSTRGVRKCRRTCKEFGQACF